MVDFQERDTTRGFDDDEDGGDEETDTGDHRAGHGGHEHGHDGDTHDEHDHGHHDVEDLGVAVVTVSSTRTIEDDPSGDAIVAAVEDAGHEVVTRELVSDDHDTIQRTVDVLVGRGDVDLVITTGGTGITPDDVTIEAVRPLLEKELPGFGELFRRVSADEIGTRVVATRATGGVADGVPVFCLPGSESAVRLGTEEVILPEAGHLVGLARRDHEHGESESKR